MMKVRSYVDRIRFRHYWNYPQRQSQKDKAVLDALNCLLWRSMPTLYLNFNIEWNNVAKAKNTKKAQKRRVNGHLTSMTKSYDALLFWTLTFRDDVLLNTSAATRKKYVLRFLESNARDFVGNVDFGKENGREHFHCVTDDNDQIREADWPYGFTNFKTVGSTSTDRQKISSYVLKLVNHAGKCTAGKPFHSRRGELREVDKLPF